LLTKEELMRRMTFTLLLTAGLLTSTWAPPAAAKAATFTERGSAVEVEPGLYCYGEEAEATWVYDYVLHITIRPDGQSMFVGSFRAEVSWSQEGEDFLVHAVVNQRFTDQSSTVLAKGTGVGSKGTHVRFDEVIQARMSPDGFELKMSRDDVLCTPATKRIASAHRPVS
jgi:hypothetical protein